MGKNNNVINATYSTFSIMNVAEKSVKKFYWPEYNPKLLEDENCKIVDTSRWKKKRNV